MSRSVKNQDVERSLRERLEAEGCILSKPRDHGETGVDILATKDGEAFHIEVIGYKSTGPARAKDFYQVFFRAVSRLNDDATHCIIALPQQFKEGLPQRAKQHRIAWKRIGDVFPELEIWLIDVEHKTYKKTEWRSYLKQ